VAAQGAADQAGSSSDSEDRPPPGCARYTVELPKPLGLVLEEGPGGRGVFVVSGNTTQLSASPEESVPLRKCAFTVAQLRSLGVHML
jgi:hypothetical protein